MIVFLVWKINISGWSKELQEVFDDEKKARECILKLSGGPQYQFSIEKMKVK